MRIMRLAVIALVAMCGIATAGSKQPETIDVWLRAGVQIDEAGHVQDLQWEEQSKVHAMIAERLAPVVRSWEFEPATADGQPAPTQTGLLIHILVDELADGSLAMRLADAQTGPSALSLAPPAYPMDAVRLGIEATVTVTVEVNADGSPVIVETTYEISDKSRSARYGKVFLASATEAVKHWKFRPELVAGHVVPGSTVRIPIDYCLGVSSSDCNRKRETAAAERKLPAGLYQGDASAVVLKTDIRGQAI
jgi:TonB family protein